jgi:thioester reductase-like protein
VEAAAPRDGAFWRTFESRVVPLRGDLEQPRLGLDADTWRLIAQETDTIYHNGAAVNYLLNYDRMRPANVVGTGEVLRLAFESRRKVFNHLSTTFIFGWTPKDVLYETDRNALMQRLDFGYSQSKWVAEQLVLDAGLRGLATRIFRPSLITPSLAGRGANFDITLRMLAFMIRHGIGVDALNQISFTPAEVAANNIVAVSNLPWTASGVFHVTSDDYANMGDITAIIARLTGRRFQSFELAAFVSEVIRRCTKQDLLFPLLDFLVGAVDDLSAMEHKRYDSMAYRRARDASPWGRPDPPLEQTVAGILRFMQRTGLSDVAICEAASRAAPVGA